MSIQGPDDEKCELVTPILTYADMDTFQELLRQLRHAGMKSSPSRGCGVHIHIGLKGLDGRDHNAKTLRNLVNIMAAHETQIGRAIKIDQGRTGHYCKVVNPDFLARVNRQKPQTMQRLADCWYTKIPIGAQATCQGVDDAGNILCAWDCGSGLSIAYGADRCHRIRTEEEAKITLDWYGKHQPKGNARCPRCGA